MRIIATVIIALFAGPILAFAEDGVSRRDAFLLIWESVRRPAFDVREEPFADIPDTSDGFTAITYAKNRGIIDDAELFHPDDRATRHDALLWIFRTRNVEELPDMQEEHLADLLNRYPIASDDPGELIGSTDELIGLMRSLDGMLAVEEHEVSLYAEKFHGDGTAFGETFDMHALTAAHRSFPHNTLVKVTNVENEASVVVRINDRGPYVDGRDMDLSLAAFTTIADRSRGVIRATFERLGDVESIDQCGGDPAPRVFQQRITRDVRFHRGVPHHWNAGEELHLGSTDWFVVRGVRYPDGTFVRMQDFVAPDDGFSFTPSDEGEYEFVVGTVDGRRRAMHMRVNDCEKNQSSGQNENDSM